MKTTTIQKLKKGIICKLEINANLMGNIKINEIV